MALTENSRILKMLQDHSGNRLYHPLSSLLDLADEVDATIPDKISIHRTIVKYVEAELKAVEYINIDQAPVGLSINIKR